MSRYPDTISDRSGTTHIFYELCVGKHNEVVEHIMNADICQLFTNIIQHTSLEQTM